MLGLLSVFKCRKWGAGVAGALTAATACFVIALVVSALNVDPGKTPSADLLARPFPATGLPLFFLILLRNETAVLFLCSGVITMGLTTAVGLISIGFLVGASTATAIANVGPTAALLSVSLYAPFEILAIILASGAGLVPITRFLSQPDSHFRKWNTIPKGFLITLSDALPLILLASFAVIVGAAAETLVISMQGITDAR